MQNNLSLILFTDLNTVPCYLNCTKELIFTLTHSTDINNREHQRTPNIKNILLFLFGLVCFLFCLFFPSFLSFGTIYINEMYRMKVRKIERKKEMNMIRGFSVLSFLHYIFDFFFTKQDKN